MRAGRKKRRYFAAVLSLSILLCGCSYYYIQDHIPDKVNVVVEEDGTFNFSLPMAATLSSNSQEVSLSCGDRISSEQIDLKLDESFQIYGSQTGDYSIECKLLGLFNLKSIEVSVVTPEYVYPMGTPVGIYLETDGIMIVGTGKVTDLNGEEQNPAGDLVQSGDYIIAVNGEPISEKEELVDLVGNNESMPVVLTIRRDQEIREIMITPVKSGEEEYKLGIWIRDDTQGIGTMTYMTEDGQFGALGHGISDLDTGSLVESDLGNLYQAQIHSVIKGTGSKPGSLCGSINYDPSMQIGEIKRNCNKGIFGTVSGSLQEELGISAIPVGYMQDVEEGPAVIRCTVEQEIKEYEIEIIRVDRGNHGNKDMIIKVTDPELLELTGGIVQGMSGSPIIQDGKIIGAVTHVLVNDPTRGYGIFLENMIEAAE